MYNQSAPINYIRLLHQKVDEEIAKLKNCCSRGCAHCCFQMVEVLHIEEPLIIDFIQNNLDEKTRDQIESNLNNWFSFFENETPISDLLSHTDVYVNFKLKQAEENIPCPFLINNECSIYAVRPISCRIHIETNYPELCISNRLRDTTFNAENIWSEVLSVLVGHIPLYIIPLPYIAAIAIQPHRELKAIKLESIADLVN